MKPKPICSDGCKFVLTKEKRYCASYQCEECGTFDVLWRNNPMQEFKSTYSKVLRGANIDDEFS
jgi:hypothetical protein